MAIETPVDFVDGESSHVHSCICFVPCFLAKVCIGIAEGLALTGGP